MYKIGLSSFFAIFLPGCVAVGPLLIRLTLGMSQGDKYIVVLYVPIAYTVGWGIYEYCYYANRPKYHELRSESWTKHFGNVKNPGPILKAINAHSDISTKIHLSHSIINHKGGAALVERTNYYLDSFRMILCLPACAWIGFLCSVIVICVDFPRSLLCPILLLQRSYTIPKDQFIVIAPVFAIAGFNLLLSIGSLFLNLALSRSSKVIPKADRFLDRALYQAGRERQDQYIASLVRGVAAIELIK